MAEKFLFIDTNVFFNHWFLRSAHFNLISNYVKNESVTVLISEVVCLEMDAKFKSESEAAMRELARTQRRLSDFQSVASSLAPSSVSENYKFEEVLRDRFTRVEIIPFDAVPHSTLVHRAISATRPFRDGEKGYRDSLIWLSLLDYLKKLPRRRQRVFFINSNASDFYEKSDVAPALHSQLARDWEEAALDIDLRLYASLKEFVERDVDTVLHHVSHEDFEEEFGSEMESLAGDAGLDYLRVMPLADMRSLLEDGGVSVRCARTIFEFSVTDFEGVEDAEIVSLSRLDGRSLHAEYRFNLLTVIYDVRVPTSNFLANESDYEDDFINIEVEGAMTNMQFYARCDFEASFTYDKELKKFTSVSIDRAALRDR